MCGEEHSEDQLVQERGALGLCLVGSRTHKSKHTHQVPPQGKQAASVASCWDSSWASLQEGLQTSL